MLVLKPIGRGNWTPVRFELPGRADLSWTNRRIVMHLPDGTTRVFWVRGVME